MKNIKKILCPVDVYDFQPEAAEYAMALAAALDAKITVVYVMEPVPPRYYGEGYYGEGGPSPSLAEEETAGLRAEAKLAEILLEFFAPCADKGEVALGYAADKIVHLAKEYSADMIVMASHGRSMMGRVIHGSVTSRVLASTKIPVLVVQPAKG